MDGSDRLRVGFVGVGDLGGTIARVVAEAGFPVTAWARRPASLEQFAGTPVATVDSLVELGARSDVVCLCVFADADVLDVLFDRGLAAALAPGATVVLHSTIRPETCQAVADRLRPLGVEVLDAPVSGGPHHAVQRGLCFMVGGDETTYERVVPILRATSESIHHLGGLGAGQRMKIVNNVLLMVNLRNALLGIDILRSLGIDPEEARTILAGSSGGSTALQTIPRIPIRRGPLADLMRKELAAFADFGPAGDERIEALSLTASAMIRHLDDLNAAAAAAAP